MAISSIGIGSGLDVESIVTQMVELEKSPIKTLEVKAEFIQSKISTYGQIKSLTDELNSAVRDLTLDRTWNTVKIDSSNSSAVNATMTGSAQAGSYNVYVEQLAQAQTSVTAALDSTEKMGAAGKLTFNIAGKNLPALSIGASDTLESIVGKINGDTELSKSVVASVVKDADGKLQLMVRARVTGNEGAFLMSVEPSVAGAEGQLRKLEFLPVSSIDLAVKTGGQVAQDAKIKLNGVSVVGGSNTFTDLVPGLSITVTEQGKSAVLNLTNDKDAVQASIQKFVDTYNALNDLLGISTKYNQESDAAGVLQGDSSTVSLQNSLRLLTQSVLGSTTGSFTRLSDIGIQMQQGGKLTIDTSKLATGLNNMDSLKALFANKMDTNGTGGGIAVKFKSLTDKLLAYDGTINSKTDSLQDQLTTNKANVAKVEARADATETRLRAQYTALDVKMASLGALSTYVEQMVSSWNNAKN